MKFCAIRKAVFAGVNRASFPPRIWGDFDSVFSAPVFGLGDRLEIEDPEARNFP